MKRWHADKLIEHILYLDGTPNMSDYFKINVGANVKAQLQSDLQVEYDAVKRLNTGIETCVMSGDDGSRASCCKAFLPLKGPRID